MAIFQVSAGYDMTKPVDIGDPLKFSNASANGFTATDPSGNVATITGSGFKFYSDGSPSAGTATNVDLKSSGTQVTLTNASVDWTTKVFDTGYNGFTGVRADQAYWLRGDDTIRGSSGNEVLTGYQGNNTIDGGAGVDTVAYTGARSSYNVTKTSTGYTVSSSAGTDTLVNVERLRFSDKSIAFDTGIADNAGQAYRLYQAALNRTPDAAGEGFYIKSLDSGQSLADISANFMASPEFKAKYGTPTNLDLVNLFYQNVLHRAGDADGIKYWTNILDTGAQSKAQVLYGFSNSPELQATLVGTFSGGIEYTLV